MGILENTQENLKQTIKNISSLSQDIAEQRQDISNFAKSFEEKNKIFDEIKASLNKGIPLFGSLFDKHRKSNEIIDEKLDQILKAIKRISDTDSIRQDNK